MQNIYDFLKRKNIDFSNNKRALNWIRRLNPETLVRIGDSYFADEKELDSLLELYVARQIAQRKKLRSQRKAQARHNFTKSKSEQPSFMSNLTTPTKEK